MKLKWVLLAVITGLLLTGIVDHVRAYSLDNVSIDLLNGAYIGIPYNQTYDGTHNNSYGYFQFNLNGSNLTFSTETNRTLYNISFNSTPDTYTFSSNGSIGWLNFSVTMVNASQNYSFYINDTYQTGRNTTTEKQVYFNYSISDVSLKSYKVNWTSGSGGGGSPPSGAPNITSYSPIDLTPTVDVSNLATFSAGSNQTASWTWAGVTEGAGDGTANSTGSTTWTTTGAKTVTVTCSNANGSCGTLQWDVTVVSDGSGGGSDYDWLSGSCSPNGAIITTDPDVGSTTCAVGTYSFGYVFDRTGVGTYTIGMTKVGFTLYSAPLLFNEDHEILNIVLTSSVSPTGIYNLSGYISNTSGYAMNNSTVRFSMQSVVTGPSGYYNFSGLSKQVNNVAADAPGYYMNFTQITLTVNRTQNLTLAPKDDTMKTSGPSITLVSGVLILSYLSQRMRKKRVIPSSPKRI